MLRLIRCGPDLIISLVNIHLQNAARFILVPSAPQRLQIVDQFSDTISVNWLRPREVNGVLIGYTVKYWKVDQNGRRIGNPMTDEVAGNALQAGITNLDSRSSYIIEVAAKTNAGVSKSAKIQGRTQDVAGLLINIHNRLFVAFKNV